MLYCSIPVSPIKYQRREVSSEEIKNNKRILILKMWEVMIAFRRAIQII